MTNTLRAKSRRVPALLATAVAMGLLVAGCSSPAQTGDGGEGGLAAYRPWVHVHVDRASHAA